MSTKQIPGEHRLSPVRYAPGLKEFAQNWSLVKFWGTQLWENARILNWSLAGESQYVALFLC